MRLHRFYVSQPLGEEVVIEDVPTIKQWLKVFRYTPSDSVIMFNGDGNEYIYELQETSPSRCLLALTETRPGNVQKRRSYLYISLIKKDLFELVCEKATECGITDIIPITTERTEKKNLNEERLRTIIKEATEQSGRGDIPTLHETMKLADALVQAQEVVAKNRVYVATLFGKNIKDEMHTKHDETSPLAFFIGPEGGWSEAEEKLFETEEINRVSLGATTLRAETAAIAVSVVIPLL